MSLQHSTSIPQSERQYDTETLSKVVGLAERLQREKGDRISASEIETIGAEVGLEPAFIHEALARVTKQEQQAVKPVEKAAQPRRDLKPWVAGWWSAGWTLPLALAAVTEGMLHMGDAGGALFFLGWMVYIGGGVALSTAAKTAEEGQQAKPVQSPQVSRTTMLELLFTLQRQLEGQKQHRAFLSVDVVGSTEMKQGVDELAVEYSFGQWRAWVEETVRGCGGEVQSAAGDGMMCIFASDAEAMRAARRLQEGMARFNGERNRLPVPFRIRCGVSAGPVAIEPGMPLGHLHSPVIDRAAMLQKRARPGEIALSGEVAAAALLELGQVTPLPEPLLGQPAFTWSSGG